ncbi:copper resistance protein B [Sulfurimonas paralvinellae]|nr:copper resistance protein B [Sulfurimonas paralvinellae]
MKNLLIKLTLLASVATASFAGGGGDILRASFTADSLEYQANDEKTIYWDTYGYIGYDLNKIYIYSEGEKVDNASADSENQLLYSRAIAPFWDIQAGVDYDIAGSEHKTWAVVALSGLAPYFFETRVALLFGDNGNVGLRIDLEYEALITQKLILTPKFTLDAYSKDVPTMEYGSGVSNITFGARLRYEIKREFAPYIGVEWSKNYGNTGKFSPLDEAYVTGGIRFWF